MHQSTAEVNQGYIGNDGIDDTVAVDDSTYDHPLLSVHQTGNKSYLLAMGTPSV